MDNFYIVIATIKEVYMDKFFTLIAIISGIIFILSVFDFSQGIKELKISFVTVSSGLIWALSSMQVPYSELTLSCWTFVGAFLTSMIRFIIRKFSATISVKREKEAAGTAVIKTPQFPLHIVDPKAEIEYHEE